MTFKQFCYEMYAQNCDERSDYGLTLLTGAQYFTDNKWLLRKKYRVTIGRLQKEWTPDYECILP